MKTDKFSYALIGTALVAVAWLVSGIRFNIDLAMVAGFGAVATILAIAAMDYGSRPLKWLENK